MLDIIKYHHLIMSNVHALVMIDVFDMYQMYYIFSREIPGFVH